MDDMVSRDEVESMIESALDEAIERRVEDVLSSLSISVREQRNWDGRELVIELELASSRYIGGSRTLSSTSWPLSEGGE